MTRQEEKQKSRDEDQRALESGEKTADELRRENGHFGGLGVVIRWDLVQRKRW